MNFSIQLSIDKFIYAFIFMKDLRFDLRSNPEFKYKWEFS